MSTEPNAAAPLRFRGGTFGLLLPFAVLLSGMLLLAAAGKAMPAAFWVPALAAVATALALAKDPAHCADLLIQGMASEMVATMLLAWFLAGIVAQLMKETGLVEGLTWLCISTGLGGRVFPLVAFLCGSFLSLATGMALGTVIALAPILYPVGVALGADGPVMAGAIISAACLGDSAAPMSDTTIAAAYTQGVDVGAVVRARLRYVLAAAAIAAVCFFVFAGAAHSGGTPVDEGSASPRGLVMLAVPALLAVMMCRGVHLIVALVSAAAAGIALGLASGLLPFERLLVVDAASFTVGGVLVEGVQSLLDIAVFALLLMGLVNLLDKGGFFRRLVNACSHFIQSDRTCELSAAALNVALCLLTVASSVTIMLEGPIAKKLLVEQRGLCPARSAVLMSGISCAALGLIPYAFAPLLTYMLAGRSGAPVDFSIGQMVLCNYYGWALALVMLFSILTGWGRAPGTSRKEH